VAQRGPGKVSEYRSVNGERGQRKGDTHGGESRPRNLERLS
jgi:hypothetical protein